MKGQYSAPHQPSLTHTEFTFHMPVKANMNLKHDLLLNNNNNNKDSKFLFFPIHTSI